MFGVGILVAMSPFISSMKPSAKAKAELPRIDISVLDSGVLHFYDNPARGAFFNGYKWKLLVYKSPDGLIRVWDIPVRNGSVGMPDIHWWRPVHSCQTFALINKVEGFNKIQITCLDTDIPEWWAKHWRWYTNGKNIEQMVDDLDESSGVIEGKYFIYGKRS